MSRDFRSKYNQWPTSFGSARGRPLRPRQRELFAELLPKIEIQVPESGKLDPTKCFSSPIDRVWVEIGFGAGEHLAFQAEKNPDVGFIGSDLYKTGIASLLTRVRERNLRNIRLFCDDARVLLSSMQSRAIEKVFILFPDPWPKTRHHKRRIISPQLLDQLSGTLIEGGVLKIATDHPSYLSWILKHMRQHPSFEWKVKRPQDWKSELQGRPITRYEKKALAAGRKCTYLNYVLNTSRTGR